MKFLEVKPSLKRYFGNEGTFTDPRDGNVYKTVEINGQVWLAENLRFEGVEHYAPDGDENNIAKYGCLYNRPKAWDACPAEWHLPSEKEIKGLLETVNYSADALRSQSWNGTNTIGFNALPAGSYVYAMHSASKDDSYIVDQPFHFGQIASFWLDTFDKRYKGYDFYYALSVLNKPNTSKPLLYSSIDFQNYFSVRCIKD